MPSLFSAILSGIRPPRIEAQANPRKISVVDQQGRRLATGQEQAVRVEISDAARDAASRGLPTRPPAQGQGTSGHGDPTAYAAMGRRERSQRAADHWQREFGAAIGQSATAPDQTRAEPQTEVPSPAADPATDESAAGSWVGPSWRSIVAMAVRAYTRVFDPDPTFSAVL